MGERMSRAALGIKLDGSTLPKLSRRLLGSLRKGTLVLIIDRERLQIGN